MRVSKFLTILFLFVLTAVTYGQSKQYVSWSFSQKKISADEFELTFEAVIEPGWHMYSQIQSPEGAPPTKFIFEKSKDYIFVGKTTEPKAHEFKEPLFNNQMVRSFDNSVTFKQKVKTLTAKPFSVKGTIEGQACNESVCSNFWPAVEFNFNCKGAEVAEAAKTETGNTSAVTPATADTHGQLKQYVSWNFSHKKISNNEIELTFKATIAPTWHMYSQIETPDGPLPTTFEFEKSDDYTLVDKTIEPKPHEFKDPMFDNQIVRSFENTAEFKQKIKLLSNRPIIVKGFIDGMACNESQCQKFSPPVEFNFNVEGSGAAESASAPIKKSNVNYWTLFIAGFLGGLLALLTPCVFPMIPMTVSFFTKQSKTKAAGIRNALIYSISIIVIYVVLGLGVTLIFGADAMNNLATNAWFNLAFFALLVVFGISFLGAFEITLPSAFVNKMDSKSEKGGLIGIFFMAFTLGLVSFSCTGPIIGTLLVQAAATGALAGPFFGMFGFSLALALPFGLFAAFPGWLNSLPKSGGWLNSVKVVLGFLELALAMKFLSNADLVYDAMIITREVFLVTWIVIFGLLGAYLMGWFKLSHDSEMKYVSVPRLMMAIITFAFTFYLIPGLWGAPLSIINGFPPPLEYTEAPGGFGGSKTNSQGSSTDNTALPEHMHSGPHGIPAFDDYYLALEYSKKVGKPIMIDFTGKACINCRKMEAEVWSNPEVKRRLSENFVLVSLYVDKKNELPAELQKEVSWNGSNRKLVRVGDRWSYLQNTKYQSSTQPQYWIIDGDENHYSDSTSYDPDIKKYIEWLDKGLEKYKAGK